jgi:hypothetical protein
MPTGHPVEAPAQRQLEAPTVLDVFEAFQAAHEMTREHLETRFPVVPLDPAAVEGLMDLVRSDLIDWEALERDERESGGWGG